MGYLIPNHDSLLDDPLYRRDLADDERRTWLDECDGDDTLDLDEVRVDMGLEDDDDDY